MINIKKILKLCLWATAITPLIVSSSVFSFGEAKNIFLRTCLFLLSILFIVSYFYKKEFRDSVILKTKLFIKNPLVISIFIFIFFTIVSTLFATDKYYAFWGTIERAEGLIGLIYFFAFFAFSLLIFEKRDWLWFFKLSLFVTLIILFREFWQFFNGVERPSSYIGNATFLAGYLLFSIFSSIIVFNEFIADPIKNASDSLENKFWKYFSLSIIIVSIVGIFITETRGTILGLIIGSIVILIYGVLKGKNIFYKEFNLRKSSIIILCILIIFSIIFITTKKNKIWQNVPGVERLATIGLQDTTTQTRLIMTKLGIDAINPVHNGVKNLLIGWGPENFSLAYEKYFNPKQFEYEIGLFDRSHNKFLDVLVMNGLLGLISYLSIWFFFFKFIYKRKEFSLTNIGLLFLGVSLFTYLIFAFDQITTYIPFFVALAFIIFINIDSDSNNEIQNYKPNFYSTHIFFSILIFILSFSFLRNDLPSHLQMRHYLSFSGEINPQVMLDTVDPAFKPFTSAQGAIRNDFLLLISGNYISQNEYMVKLMDKAFLKAEEYVEKRPYDINFMITLASVYTNQGGNLGNIDLLKKGEEYSRKILVYSPNKQTCNYDLALNLLYQKRYAESFDYFEKSFNPTPSFFSLEAEKNLNIYFFFTKYFYSIKDKDNFIKAVNRLKENNFKEADDLSRIVDYINKYNYWPHVSFTK